MDDAAQGRQAVHRAVVVAPSQGNLPLSGQNMMREVIFENCLFDFTKGDRSIISLRSTDSVLFRNCAFIARDHAQPNITIDDYPEGLGDTKTDRIVFQNCKSRGVRLAVKLNPGTKYQDIHCPGETLRFSGITGEKA